MKCPNCGWEIQDGHLICEQCGHEIRIVPDFEPDPDIQIDDQVVGELLDEPNADPEGKKENNSDDTSEIDLDFTTIRHRAVMSAAIAAASILLIVGAVWLVLRLNSFDHQLNKAKSLSSEGKYEEAISALENLYVSNPDKSEIFFLEADYYAAMGENAEAADTLKRIIGSKDYSDDDKYTAYDHLFSIYAEEEDYESINSELEQCEFPEVVNAYQNYMAMEPVFSIEGGEYSESQWLKLSANTSGNIYVTTDGSKPDENSDIYSGPIRLEGGSYVISAVFVNQYGISSDVVVNTYNVTSDVPAAPTVNFESGEYHSPSMITVDVPEGVTVYYTTDKSTPTIDSVPYTDPIPMPVSYSNFNFIAVNDQGIYSEETVRSYNLTFPDGISPTAAAGMLKDRLIERGMLTGTDGRSDRAPGIYTYETISAVPIEGQGDYYTVREFYHDPDGIVSPTDTTYIVEIYQGSTAILGGDAVNGFIAISF